MNKKILVIGKNIGFKATFDKKNNIKLIQVNPGHTDDVKSVEITVGKWWEFWK